MDMEAVRDDIQTVITLAEDELESILADADHHGDDESADDYKRSKKALDKVEALLYAAPDLLAALEEAERVIRWAVQESAGRVKAEIVGGWKHHADKARAAIEKAKKGGNGE